MKRKTPLIVAAVLLVAVAFVWLTFFAPPGPHFTCHRQFDGMVDQWRIETESGNWFPNVEGSSVKSLALLGGYSTGDYLQEMRDYRYVPGLNHDDPEDLIIMYVERPSSRKWHGDLKWYRMERRWVVLNSKTSMGNRNDGGAGELCEWIPTNEFTNRLAKTLQFLAENERPHWTNAVKEHSEFLLSLQK